MPKPAPKKRNFKKPYVPDKRFRPSTASAAERKKALRTAKYKVMAKFIKNKTKAKRGIKEIAAELAYQDFKAGKD